MVRAVPRRCDYEQWKDCRVKWGRIELCRYEMSIAAEQEMAEVVTHGIVGIEALDGVGITLKTAVRSKDLFQG